MKMVGCSKFKQENMMTIAFLYFCLFLLYVVFVKVCHEMVEPCLNVELGTKLLQRLGVDMVIISQ